MQVHITKRLKCKSDLQYRLVGLVNSLDAIANALECRRRRVGTLIQQHISGKVKVVPIVVDQVAIRAREIGHGLKEVETNVRVAGHIREYPCHHKIVLMIFSNRSEEHTSEHQSRE